MARTYAIETFGCQMNVHDSEQMAGLLEQAGYEPARSADAADLVVLNTCSVRARAEEKLYSRLGELRHANTARATPQAIAVTGCVAQQEGAALLRRAPFVRVIAGTRGERRIAGLVAESARTSRPALDVDARSNLSFPLGVVHRADPVRASVTIVEGCDDVCAFCVVPYTRGRERMRPAVDILAEVREAVSQGHREILLLGQIVNHYQAPDVPGCDFAGLLARVNDVAGVARIRFASPHPRHVTARLIEAMRDLPRVCKHLHLPVQSGSTRILAAMRRRHTREEYLELVSRVRAAVPGIALSTDMVVGFPGETAEDFAETLSLTRTVRYHSMFSFRYSERPHTFASKNLGNTVSEPEKASRLQLLQGLQRDIQLELHRQAVGTVVEVLADSTSRRNELELSGRTTGNIVVSFPGPRDFVGQLVDVTIRRAGPNSLRGELARPAP